MIASCRSHIGPYRRFFCGLFDLKHDSTCLDVAGPVRRVIPEHVEGPRHETAADISSMQAMRPAQSQSESATAA
jgi:hypothetical protein